MRAVEGAGEQMRLVDGMAVFYLAKLDESLTRYGLDTGDASDRREAKPLMTGSAQERLAGPDRARSHLGYGRVGVV